MENPAFDPYARSLLYAEQQADFVEDLPLWLELARECTSPESKEVLELGSGSGRVSFHLASHGFRVHGLDNSIHMVEYCRSVASAESLATMARFDCADMRDFQVEKPQDLIILPFNSLCHLTTDADFASAMSSVRKALRPGGYFVFHLFAPLGRFLDTDPGSLRQVAEFGSPSQEENYEVFETNSYDHFTQINQIQWFYQGDKDESEVFEVRYRLRLYYPAELALLLYREGFSIQEICHDYQRKPANGDSLSYTYICRMEP